MFHVDLTFEDMRIVAQSPDGATYHTKFLDNLTGQERVILNLSSNHLRMIFAFNMDNNGEPEGFEKFYEELEPLFVGWPIELRPIP